MKILGVLGIVLVVIGIAAAVAIPFSPQIAKALASGPTVKSHGDFYAQAFVVLLIWAGLDVFALVASLAAWITAMYAGASFTAKLWCWRAVPLACAASLWFGQLLTRRSALQ